MVVHWSPRRVASRAFVVTLLGLAGSAQAADNLFIGIDFESWSGDTDVVPWSLGNVPLGGEFVFLLNDPAANPNTDGVSPFTVTFAGPANATPLGGLTISGLSGAGNQLTLLHSEEGLALDTHGLFLGTVVGAESIGGIGQYSLGAGIVNVTATEDDPFSGNVVLGAGLGGVGLFDHNNFGGADAIVNITGPAVDFDNTAAGYGGYLLVGAAPLSYGQYTIGEEFGLGLVQLNVQNRIDVGGSGLTELSGGFCIADSSQCSGLFVQNGGEVFAGSRLGNTGGINLGNGIGDGDNRAVGTYELNFGFLEAGVVNVGLLSSGVFTQQGGSANLGTLIVANAAGSDGVYDIQGGSLDVLYAALVGVGGSGEVVQVGGSNVLVGTAGSNEVGNDLILGMGAGSFGRYILGTATNSEESPTLEVTDALVVGLRGVGEFVHSAGLVTVGALRMGSEEGVCCQADPPGSGTYRMNGGELNAGSITVAENGQGLFVQSGGVVNTGTLNFTNSGLVALPDGMGGFLFFSQGTYLLQGGTLNTAETRIGGFGLAYMEQGGESVHTVTGDLVIADQPGLAEPSSGTFRNGNYLKTGGALEVGGAMIVGGANNFFEGEPGGLGTFEQFAGTTGVGVALVVGQSADIGGGQGFLRLTGGELVVGTDDVNADASIGGNGVGGVVPGGLADGAGTVEHSGGLFKVVGGLFLSNGNGLGTYTLSGSGELDTLTTVLGNDAARFTQTGGTHSTLFLNVYGGVYGISGGVVNVAANMGVGGPFADAEVDQSGGEVHVNDAINGLFIGSFGNTGTYHLDGGLLEVVATTHLAGDGLGIFNNRAVHRTGSLLISENETGAATGVGLYQLLGGTLEAGSVSNRGTFRIDGGSVTATTSFVNEANGVVRGRGTIAPVILNHGLVLAEAGTLAVTVDGQSGTVQAGTGATIQLTGNSDAAFLDLAGGTLDTGSGFDFTVDSDYTNAAFGNGDAFDGRANVTGSGLILASGDVQQTIVGDVSNGGTGAPSIRFVLREGESASAQYGIAITGTTGPTVRGAIQTGANGGDLFSVAGFNGEGPVNFELAAGASTGLRIVGFTAAAAGQSVAHINVANNFDDVQDQLITVTADVFRAAIADVQDSNVGFVRVGTSRAFSAAVLNLGATDGFTEDLVATVSAVTGSLSAVNPGVGGALPLIPAAGINAAFGQIDVTAAGLQSGSVTFDLASGGAGTNSGLAALSLGSQTSMITATGVDFANPTVQASLNFGNVLRNSSQEQGISVGNVVVSNAAFQDALNASFAAAGMPPTGIEALLGSITGLGAGATDGTSMRIRLDTSATGAVSASVEVLLASDGSVFGLGTTNLPSHFVNVLANVVALVGDLATPVISPTTVDFGEFHIGAGSASQAVSIANATAIGEGLIVDVGAPGGSFGLTSNVPPVIGPATTVANALVIDIDRAIAGDQGGTVTLGLRSDGSFNMGTETDLGTQAITVLAKGFALAEGTVLPAGGMVAPAVHVGDIVGVSFDLANVGPATGGFTESLDASLTAVVGGLTGGVTGLAQGAAALGAITGQFDTSTAGVKTLSAVVDFRSNGAGLNSLGVTDIADGAVSASTTVWNYAEGEASATSLSLAARRVGDAAASAVFGVSNVAPAGAFTEGLDYTASGPASPVSATGATGATNLAAGTTGLVTVSLDTATSGSFGSTITLDYVSNGTNSGLANTDLGSDTVAVSGNVYQAAQAQALDGTVVDFGVVRVGDAATLVRSLANAATGALVDALVGSLSGPSAPFTADDGDLDIGVEGNGGRTDLLFALDTNVAGVFGDSVGVTLASHNDEMADLALDGLTYTLSGTVHNLAAPEFAQVGGDGSLTRSSDILYVWDFGSIDEDAGGTLTGLFSLANLAVGPADDLSGSFVLGGLGAFGQSGFVTFADIAAGDALGGLTVNFDVGAFGRGNYSGSIFLDALSTFDGLDDVGLDRIELRLVGRVTSDDINVPSPATVLLMLLGVLGMVGARRRVRA